MAMNSPSGPIEATRNASMIASVMASRDREKGRDGLDERERDRLEQEQMHLGEQAIESAKGRRNLFQRVLDRIPFF